MADFTLIIGNKNYSSWSLRAWLVMKHTGAAFDEVVIPLDLPDTGKAIGCHSAAGRVPVLRHGERTIWDSLAIAEYLAEQFPDLGLWPADIEARAMARAICSEMHAGFMALREHLPMDLRARHMAKEMPPDVIKDITRINAIWTNCRRLYSTGGSFLFGNFSIADAFYAPVVGRFRAYGIESDGEAGAYVDALWQWPDMQTWLNGANDESWVIDNFKI
jgi:glutathione S-transferase